MSQPAAQRGWSSAGGRGRAGPHGAMRAGDQDRDAVVGWLGTAYVEGRLGKNDLDHRLDRALTATTLAELNATVEDLHRPAPARPMPLRWSERGWSFTAHLAGLFISFVGPLLVLLGAGRRSAYVREQAVEALNWQLSFILLNLTLVVAAVPTLGLAALLWIPIVLLWPWLVLVAALQAAIGSPLRPRRMIRLVR